jgi:hypothetical protein
MTSTSECQNSLEKEHTGIISFIVEPTYHQLTLGRPHEIALECM